MKDRPFEFRADARAASPLYMQLAQRLAQAIRNNDYQPDEALPSERVLSESLSLSRVTARKAIDQLVEQGLVVRRRGSGNYIAPRLEQPLSRLTSFSEELHQRGFTPSSRWLARVCTAAAPDEQLSLGLSPGSRVARLERLRLADNVVMAYEVSVLPEQVLPHPSQVDASLYAHLATLGRAPVRALQHLRALNAEQAPGSIAQSADRTRSAVHHAGRLSGHRPGGRAHAFVLPQRLLRFRGRDEARSVSAARIEGHILTPQGFVRGKIEHEEGRITRAEGSARTEDQARTEARAADPARLHRPARARRRRLRHDGRRQRRRRDRARACAPRHHVDAGHDDDGADGRHLQGDGRAGRRLPHAPPRRRARDGRAPGRPVHQPGRARRAARLRAPRVGRRGQGAARARADPPDHDGARAARQPRPDRAAARGRLPRADRPHRRHATRTASRRCSAAPPASRTCSTR